MFAGEMLTILAPGSAYAYLREIVLFADWAARDSVAGAHDGSQRINSPISLFRWKSEG